MVRMPIVPEGWLDGDDSAGDAAAPDAGLSKAEAPLTITGLLREATMPKRLRGTSLSLIMEPHEIADVPGLPDHVYEGLGVAGASSPKVRPAGYQTSLDRVSLTPMQAGDAGLEPSRSPEGINRGSASDRWHQGARAAGIVNGGNTFWDAGNRVVSGIMGLEGEVGRLGDHSKWAGRVLEPLANGLEAQSEVAKGAPKIDAYNGATWKTITGLAGAEGGAEIGALAGTPLGPPGIIGGTIIGGIVGGFAPNLLFGNRNQSQTGRLIAQTHADYVRNDPWAAFP